jgi:hypothetical protein
MTTATDENRWGNNPFGLKHFLFLTEIAFARSFYSSKAWKEVREDDILCAPLPVVRKITTGTRDKEDDTNLWKEANEVGTSFASCLRFALNLSQTEEVEFEGEKFPVLNRTFVAHAGENVAVYMIKRNGAVEVHLTPFHVQGKYLSGVCYLW